jgi:hypothetical protein
VEKAINPVSARRQPLAHGTGKTQASQGGTPLSCSGTARSPSCAHGRAVIGRNPPTPGITRSEQESVVPLRDCPCPGKQCQENNDKFFDNLVVSRDDRPMPCAATAKMGTFCQVLEKAGTRAETVRFPEKPAPRPTKDGPHQDGGLPERSTCGRCASTPRTSCPSLPRREVRPEDRGRMQELLSAFGANKGTLSGGCRGWPAANPPRRFPPERLAPLVSP